jgi:cellulose synthase/poly-beta-1,6-N-acetylglucosamine synthase-like glycosyltransferase
MERHICRAAAIIKCSANLGSFDFSMTETRGSKTKEMEDTKNASPPLELAVVIPTFNERDNVRPVLNKLANALTGIRYEAIFVDDDSQDGTADCVRAIARTDPYVRVLQRVRRRGLASACLEGMMATAAPYIAVMDADLQAQIGESRRGRGYAQRRWRQYGRVRAASGGIE